MHTNEAVGAMGLFSQQQSTREGGSVLIRISHAKPIGRMLDIESEESLHSRLSICVRDPTPCLRAIAQCTDCRARAWRAAVDVPIAAAGAQNPASPFAAGMPAASAARGASIRRAFKANEEAPWALDNKARTGPMERTMREDMSKVLVEEPRHGRSFARAIQGQRRQRWNQLDPDGEGGPVHIGMRYDRLACKHFGEHLGPLYRYLDKQVHRPWNKVYSELCAGLDRRSVVQNHLFEHIGDHVALRTALIDGEVHVHARFRTISLADARQALYVHPRTGILLPNRARDHAERRRKLQSAERRKADGADRRTDIHGLGPDRQWRRIDGLWYEVQLRPLQGDAPVFDIVLRRIVSRQNCALLLQAHGHHGLAAVAKRQLDGRTLARHGLR